MINDLIGVDLTQPIAQILQLVYSPTSNVFASALLLLGVITLFAIVLIIIIIFVLGRARDGEDDSGYEIGLHDTIILSDAVDEDFPRAKRTHLRRLVFFTGVAVLMWITAGVSTSYTYVCTPCHADTPHMKPRAGATHAKTSCVRCHEAGGVVASATIAVPSRVIHIAQGLLGRSKISEYGYVDSSACRSCHEEITLKTTVNEKRGISVSHKEPLKAGARCVDCHRPNKAGVVSGSYAGMNPCMRCHDGTTVSNECVMCHSKDIGYTAIADSMPSPDTAKVLVAQPYDCYGCHDPKPCDSCHTTRLPHTKEFIAGGHAYQGAVSLWSGSRGSCTKCHTATRNNCAAAGCHGAEFPFHYAQDKSFPQTHSSGRWVRTGDLFATSSELPCDLCHDADVCEKCH